MSAELVIAGERMDDAPDAGRDTPQTFEEFWPYYLGEHAKPGTRAVHLIATGIGLAGGAAALALLSKKIALAAVAGAYGLAWGSHALVERNRPATFTNPLWSLRADLRMFGLWVTGGLREELIKAGIEVAPAKPRLSERDRRRRAVARERFKRREDELKDRRKLAEKRFDKHRKRAEKSRKAA